MVPLNESTAETDPSPSLFGRFHSLSVHSMETRITWYAKCNLVTES